MSFSPNINVWTLGRGANGRWKLHHATDTMEDAALWFRQLEEQGKQVVLYELGQFEHEGQQIAGQVAFWWSASLNGMMQREPEDRGVGWSDGYDTWVEYIFPDQIVAGVPAVQQQPGTTAVVAPVAPPAERYLEAACDQCGLILPMNRLQRFTHEVRTGRTSGTYRTSHSTSSRSSKSGFSSGSTFGSSSTSGRKFFKTETLLLCEGCHAEQTAQSPSRLLRVCKVLLKIAAAVLSAR